MQSLLKEQMKDLVGSLLNVNVYILKSDTTERSLFDCDAGAMKYYWPIRPPTYVEFIFFWLVGLSLLVGSTIDPHCTKSEYHSQNGDLSNRVEIVNKVDDEVLWADRLPSTNIDPFTDLNRIKNESQNDYYNMSEIIIEKISFTKEK